MAIRLQTISQSFILDPQGFTDEVHMQSVLRGKPSLLLQSDEAALAFVGREVELLEAGRLDLLFVSSEGLPVAVETKLERNGQSRRKVVAQLVDYLAALSGLTNDELEHLTKGGLSRALRSFERDEYEEEFDRTWTAVGSNLRSGIARVVIALDAVPDGLERIVSYLAESSELDIQLISMERYLTADGTEIIVPRIHVSSRTVQRSSRQSQSRAPYPELVDAVVDYNKVAPPNLQAFGTARNYRQIKPKEWSEKFRVHYEYMRAASYIGVEIHLESDNAKPLAEFLRPLANTSLAPDYPPMLWDPNWQKGRGRLTCRVPLEAGSSSIASAMSIHILRTQTQIAERLNVLSQEQPDLTRLSEPRGA